MGGEEDTSGEALKEQREALNQLSPGELLRKAHFGLLRELLAKLEIGVLTHQEAAILRNMLRDNGMVLGVPPVDMPQDNRETPVPLPVYEDGEDYEHA